MLGLLLTAVVVAFFAGLISLITKLSGRAYPGQVTTSVGNEVDYDDPYPGWGARMFGMNTVYERKLVQPEVPFERWPESRSA